MLEGAPAIGFPDVNGYAREIPLNAKLDLLRLFGIDGLYDDAPILTVR